MGRHQANLMSELGEFAPPEVRRRTSLHADQAGRDRGEVSDHLAASEAALLYYISFGSADSPQPLHLPNGLDLENQTPSVAINGRQIRDVVRCRCLSRSHDRRDAGSLLAR